MPPVAVAGGIGIAITNSPNTVLLAASPTAALRYKHESFKRYLQICQLRIPQSRRMRSAVTALSNNNNSRLSRQPCENLHSLSQGGTKLLHLSAASTPLLSGDHGSLAQKIPLLPTRRMPLKSARAFKGESYSLQFPTITKKPEWWWRTLACVPYLMALQMSSTAYYVLPLLEHIEFDNLIYYVPGVVQRLPFWFPMVYFNLAYFGVVRNKELPHFIRFHVMMAMLLETALDVVWYSSNFMPLVHYNGTYGMQYWAVVGFGYILILLECIRSAVSGTYARIPFVSESALIHTLFNIGRYYRPF